MTIGLACFTTMVSAQEIRVTGQVTDEADGTEIIGATVVIKGKPTSGTITDVQGKYGISVLPDDTLQFSYVGYAPVSVTVEGRNVIDIIMSAENILIDEVVVTALGMKREKKALGYSVQEVDGEELKQTKELNVLNSLSGKVAGVNITQGGGGLNGGGARIVILSLIHISEPTRPY